MAHTLELAIIDFCNLACHNCGQGTPWQKAKETMSLEYLEKISTLIKPHEFSTIKISGGEPTLHRQFGEICTSLKRLFPAQTYELATNGLKLHKYLEESKVFDLIDLSNYPGMNDEVYNDLISLELPNVNNQRKYDGDLMLDIRVWPNAHKKRVYERCGWPRGILKVVQDRIYPCCISFGLTSIRNDDYLTPENLGVLLDENWRENLSVMNLEKACVQCWIDVPS